MRVTTTPPAVAPSAPAAAPRTAGSYVGTLGWSIGRTWTSTQLLIDHIVGQVGGYGSARDARIAAALLTKGDRGPAVVLSADGDGRFRLYSATYRVPFTDDEQPIALEPSRPRLPSGAVLTDWIWGTDGSIVELRDGTKRIFPWHA